MLHFNRRRITAYVVALCFFVACFIWVLSSELRAEKWREDKSKHFRVFYLEDAAFASAVISHAEEYYSQINVDLGLNHVLKRDRVPWLWDKRCRIYLYPDKDEYAQATRSPPWSEGKVNYRERIIWSFSGSEHFLEGLLPHELAHILFREYVGFDNIHVPRWLDEGVAQYAEVGRREKSLEIMRRWLEEGTYIPLDKLKRLNLNLAAQETAQLFYVQSVTLVHYFLTQYGGRRLIDLCSALRDGYTFERALSIATSSSVGSMNDLEEDWIDFVLH